MALQLLGMKEASSNKNKPYDEVLGAAQHIKLEFHLIV